MSRARDRADGVLHNRTHEDTDGGRESLITFKGEQSGGEISTLAQIQASHDGTSDDEKGDLIFKTNDGSDGSSPTEAMRITSTQDVGIGDASPESNTNYKALTVSSTSGSGGGQVYVQSSTVSSVFGADNAGSGPKSILQTTTNHPLVLGTNNAERLRVTEHGLTFNGDTAEANALSDYEYGTFSPTYTTSVGDATGVTYTPYNVGSYVKIGNVVHFQLQLSINAMTSAGSNSPRIGGLPYNTSSSAPLNETTRFPVSTYVVDYITSSTAGYVIQAYFPTSNVNYLQFLLTQDAYAWSVLSVSQFTLSAGDYVSIMGTYFAD